MIQTEGYRRRLIIVLLLGLVLTGLGLSQFSNIWISKTDLQKINGTLSNARTNISWTFTKSIRNPSRILKSHKSELIFRLNEHDQEYYLTENVGEHYVDDKYETILKSLRNADSISVWIKKNEESVRRPQVLQIDSGQTTLLDFSHLHLENNLVAGLEFIIGVFFIFFYILALFRDKSIST